MHHSGPLPLTFKGPEQVLGLKTAQMWVRENPGCKVSSCGQRRFWSGRFESSLDTHVLSYVFRRSGSNVSMAISSERYAVLVSLVGGPLQAKICLRSCAKCSDSDSSHACIKSDPGSCCSSCLHFVVSNNSVSGKRRSWLDFEDAQTDLGLCCAWHGPGNAVELWLFLDIVFSIYLSS